LAGILIGAKENLSEKMLEDFRKTGVIHIVVLSGFNLSILAEFIIILLSVFGRKISAIFGSISIILFAIMTGASATIVRASLMALLIILAKSFGRQTEALKLLFVAGFLMLVNNPMLLLYDPSFQLSFLATLGLIILAPKIQS
jgi:competence protein ComEC